MAFRDELEAQIPAMRRYARALTRNRETADDLVQEALMRALDAEPRWHAGNIRSWLFTILTNVNRNRLRALGRRACGIGRSIPCMRRPARGRRASCALDGWRRPARCCARGARGPELFGLARPVGADRHGHVATSRPGALRGAQRARRRRAQVVK
jgi:hypothetical protein